MGILFLVYSWVSYYAEITMNNRLPGNLVFKRSAIAETVISAIWIEALCRKEQMIKNTNKAKKRQKNRLQEKD